MSTSNTAHDDRDHTFIHSQSSSPLFPLGCLSACRIAAHIVLDLTVSFGLTLAALSCRDLAAGKYELVTVLHDALRFSLYVSHIDDCEDVPPERARLVSCTCTTNLVGSYEAQLESFTKAQ